MKKSATVYGDHSTSPGPAERAKLWAKAGLYYSGYYSFRSAWRRVRHRGRRLIILAYHNIRPDNQAIGGDFQPNHHRVPLTAAAFDLHLSVLSRHFEIVSLDQGVERLTETPHLDETNVAITFDDGYETFFTLAYPLLKKRGFPATVFLATDYIETGRAFWWDELTQMVFQLEYGTLSTSELTACIGDEASADFANVRDFPSRLDYLFTVERFLARLPDSERTARLQRLGQLLRERKGIAFKPERTISWQQARDMLAYGIRFGSHTCSHPKLEDAHMDQAEAELVRSKEVIEHNTGQAVTSFAYPYGQAVGNYHRLEDMLRRCGYRNACTMEMAVNEPGANPYLLSRGVVIPEGPRFQVHRDLILCGLSRSRGAS
jgi:peptidoglycan/xylan/chitin deacetylase (PgdA/CDA1 family)